MRVVSVTHAKSKLLKLPPFSLSTQAQDEGVNIQEEDAVEEFFSRRKLESNWDRYAESEKQEPDDGTPAQRGTDYHVLLGSAGKMGTGNAGRVCVFDDLGSQGGSPELSGTVASFL